jgi:hypothetical protein
MPIVFNLRDQHRASIAVKKTILKIMTGAKTKMDVSPCGSFVKLSQGGYIHEHQNTTVAPNCQSDASAFAKSL